MPEKQAKDTKCVETQEKPRTIPLKVVKPDKGGGILEGRKATVMTCDEIHEVQVQARAVGGRVRLPLTLWLSLTL